MAKLYNLESVPSEELEEELEKRRNRKKTLEFVRPIDIIALEKIARGFVNNIEASTGGDYTNFEHYVFEGFMEIMFGEMFWDWYVGQAG